MTKSRKASQADRSIQETASEVGAVTDATSSSHCQIGQETTVWQINPVSPIEVSNEQKEQAMTKVMELYSSAEYKPVTIQELRSRVLDIMKEAYQDKPSELQGVNMLDPSRVEISDADTVQPDLNMEVNRTPEQVYQELEYARGVSELRCFIAQNIDDLDYDSVDHLEQVARAFRINEAPDGSGQQSLSDYILYEMNEMPAQLQEHGNANQVCDNLSIRVDGAVDNPRNYRVVVSAFGNRLFDSDDEPQGEMEVDSESEDDFERGAREVSRNLGFMSDDSRFNDSGPMRLSELESDEMLSPVGTLSDIDNSDNESVGSLPDLNDFDPPISPEGQRSVQFPSTPINLVPRLSDGVQIDGDLTERRTPENPRPAQRRRLETPTFETPPRTPTNEGNEQ